MLVLVSPPPGHVPGIRRSGTACYLANAPRHRNPSPPSNAIANAPHHQNPDQHLQRTVQPHPHLDACANIRSLTMTSEGSPYSRFRRALETGNELLVLTTARELPQIALDDALRICLVLRDGDPERYDRAAVRWLGRFALEGRAVTIRDLRSAARALAELPEMTAEAMERLQQLCVARGVS
jgi:hypothetical protein